MSKIPVYFMPGLAASSLIFERIKLPEQQFEMFFLEWEIPFEKESLADYVKRLAAKVTEENPVLIGVSFGGIIVQEMKKYLNPKQVIIISSVKNNKEFPRRMKFAKITKAHKLIPVRMISDIEWLMRFSFGETVKKRIILYEKFLSMRDPFYLTWSLDQIINWDRTVTDEEVVHVHGDQDEVFPIKYISKCIVLKGGTHIMIINKYKWLNENLPKIILGTSD